MLVKIGSTTCKRTLVELRLLKIILTSDSDSIKSPSLELLHLDTSSNLRSMEKDRSDISSILSPLIPIPSLRGAFWGQGLIILLQLPNKS